MQNLDAIIAQGLSPVETWQLIGAVIVLLLLTVRGMAAIVTDLEDAFEERRRKQIRKDLAQEFLETQTLLSRERELHAVMGHTYHSDPRRV